MAKAKRSSRKGTAMKASAPKEMGASKKGGPMPAPAAVAKPKELPREANPGFHGRPASTDKLGRGKKGKRGGIPGIK